MTINKKRLAAFDMDGTLLNDKKEITPKTEKVLKELQKQAKIRDLQNLSSEEIEERIKSLEKQ